MSNTDDMIRREATKTEIRKLVLEIADTPLVDEYTAKLAIKLGELVLKKIDEMTVYNWTRERAALLAALRQADQDCTFCAGSKVNQEACEAADYGCESCEAVCICRDRRGNSGWSWCGMKEDGSELENCICDPFGAADTGAHPSEKQCDQIRSEGS